jgi:polysaccharide export outer membrane protein
MNLINSTNPIDPIDPINPINPLNPRPLEPWNPRTLLGRCSVRKAITSAIVTLWIVLLSTTFVQSQGNKDDVSKRPPQADMIAVSERYVIGPEDVLYVHVWREEALSRTVPVRTDGKISLPLINDIQAAGLTPLQLREILTQKFKVFIDNPNVSVVVTEANSMKVYVSGQVKSPGVYRLRSETTVLQIIPMAGGFTDWANQKKILIIRNEDGREKRFTVNYKKIVKGDAPETNIRLKAGDTIIVP